ncbi:hypothetical protein T484DRAFT_1881626 [Baffinella frigidus]|nr:hypothetical protein T484DRAFT_1881626 [Cryptophyta sp. CCMP2293]
MLDDAPPAVRGEIAGVKASAQPMEGIPRVDAVRDEIAGVKASAQPMEVLAS